MDVSPEFTARLQTYYDGCTRIYQHYRRAKFPDEPEGVLILQELRHRYRILYVDPSGKRTAHSFVELNGDVMRPVSFYKFSPHPRGNINDEHNGLGEMGPYGPHRLTGPKIGEV